MVARCREKAGRDGLSPTLWAEPMHELDPPRSYGATRGDFWARLFVLQAEA